MSPWTLADVPDQSDRTVLVTGANSGLGFEATRALAAAGATVVMACRSPDRGASAAAGIRGAVPDADLDVRECDLASLASVASFADGVRDAYDELHVLCNNAGVMAIPRRETEDGFEYQFGVNHLGHFALTGHLLDLVVGTPGETRVVTHSSGAHRAGDIDFADLHGRASTGLQARGPRVGSRLKLAGMKLANALIAQPAERGALPMLYAATADGVSGGEYVDPGGLFDMRGYPEIQEPSDRARDPDLAERLWAVSEDETGVSIDV